MSDINSTWPTAVDMGGVRDFIKGLQDEQRARHEQTRKGVEKAIMVGLGTWALGKAYEQHKAKKK